MFMPFGPWRPDLTDMDSECTAATNVVPGIGFYSPQASLRAFSNALGNRCQGAVSIMDSAGNTYWFAGDDNELYLINSATTNWSIVSRSMFPDGIGRYAAHFAFGTPTLVNLAALFAAPFSSASAQNRRVGSGAQFGTAAHPYSVALQLNGSPNLNAGQGFAGGFTIVVLAVSTDASVTVTYNGDGSGGANLPVTLKMPAVTPNATGDRVVIVFNTVDNQVYEFYHFDWNAGVPTAGLMRTYNPTGLGHPTSSNTSRVGLSASGCSVLVGLVRGTELGGSGAIQHIMSASMANQGVSQQLSNTDVYPAFHVDSFCDGVTKCIGAIPYGQPFAIPPGVDKASLGLSALGGRLFDQLTDYGLRPLDGAANNAHNRGDQTVTAGQRNEFDAQMALLWPHLLPILNDDESQSETGGGT